MLELIFTLVYEGFKEIKFRFYYQRFYAKTLSRNGKYYASLPRSKRIKFLRTVRDNYDYFEFVPRKNIILTRKMRTIVSGAAAQLTFLLPSECLTFFKKIIIYPADYYSRITRLHHKGEVNPGFRLIVFSWKSVLEGLDKNVEGKNLLLHEFAHALWLEHKLMHHEYSTLDEKIVEQFEVLAARELNLSRTKEEHFLRRYAFSNREEFFAVAVENFFERPLALKAAMPDLYAILVNLLNQNPISLNTSSKEVAG